MVKVFLEIAAKHAVDKVGPRDGRGKVSSMVDNILKCPGLTTSDCRIVTENMTAYEKLFKRRRVDDPPPATATELTT